MIKLIKLSPKTLVAQQKWPRVPEGRKSDPQMWRLLVQWPWIIIDPSEQRFGGSTEPSLGYRAL